MNVDKLASSIPQVRAFAVMHLHVLVEAEHSHHVLHLMQPAYWLAYHQKGIIHEEFHLSLRLQLFRPVECPHTQSLVSGSDQSCCTHIRLQTEGTYLPESLRPVVASILTVLPKDRLSQSYGLA